MSRINHAIAPRRPEDHEEAGRDHERGLLALRMACGISLASLVFAAFLCRLFLHYGRPEQAEKVVATPVGIAGGFGLGRAWAVKRG